MISTEIYLIILVILTIFIFSRNSNVLAKLLFCMYTVVALFSVISVNKGIIQAKNISFLPYGFLIICYVLYFSPFIKNDIVCNAEKMEIVINGKIKFIAFVYVICSMVAISCYLPSVLKLMSSGSWATNRVSLYRNELMTPYSNYIQFYSIQFASYFKTLAIIIGFGLLRKLKKGSVASNFSVRKRRAEIIMAYLTIASAIGFMTISSMYGSSRGSIVNIFIFVMAVYLFFYYEIEANRRKFITIMSILVVVAIIPYIVEVTKSRFTIGGSVDSVIWYLGQAPVVFNQSIFDLPKHAWGNFGIGMLWGTPFSEYMVGGTWNTGFYTFVGWLCIDWSPIGVVIIGIITAYIVGKVVKKSKYRISDVFLILTYYQTLANGVFVIGRSYIYTLLGSLFIYLFLKLFIEKIHR